MNPPTAKLHDQVEDQDSALVAVALDGSGDNAVHRLSVGLPGRRDQRNELLPQEDRDQAFLVHGVALAKPSFAGFDQCRMNDLIHETERVKPAGKTGILAFRFLALPGDEQANKLGTNSLIDGTVRWWSVFSRFENLGTEARDQLADRLSARAIQVGQAAKQLHLPPIVTTVTGSRSLRNGESVAAFPDPQGVATDSRQLGYRGDRVSRLRLLRQWGSLLRVRVRG